jgi:hypothetical protein
LGVVEEIKILVCNNHNRAEEVIRRGADRDLVQVQKTIEDLSQKLVVSDQ